MPRRCDRCEFYQPTEKGRGQCRAAAPQLLVLAPPPGPIVQGGPPPAPMMIGTWPPCQDDSWCGQFKLRIGVVRQDGDDAIAPEAN
ncbi:hypothetical protein [Anaeromyxobacter oryzisoli]|uniref:hypothetical protein n=1 Tax=Anaeromyxobacter oryzisoli TaxID=2925408 RepID=UPI001F55C7EC|nr:hypothetical protein [Anaeromyxobacter sp. SG63]